uniref:Putative glutamate-gated kainate-type ion channel receptor subunit glur5 n=1 Tax=Anopheles marajoara TaxID=58244 RepID=A0A2M4BFM9_9DIPT
MLPLLLLSVSVWSADRLQQGQERKRNPLSLTEQIELIFASIDAIDIVTPSGGDYGSSVVRSEEQRHEERLLQQPNRTVRRYSYDSPMEDACTPELSGQWDRFRSQWNENARTGAGYVVYGNLSALLAAGYECLFDPLGTYLLLLATATTTVARKQSVQEGQKEKEEDEQKEEKVEWPHEGPQQERQNERDQLLAVLRLIWSRQGAFRVFVQLHSTVLTYDPFASSPPWQENEEEEEEEVPDANKCPVDRQNPAHGVLIDMANGAPLPSVPWHNFHGLPVRVEVFRSVYSNPVTRGGATMTTVYRGADITARDVLQQYLNITVIHVPADADLFGDRMPNGSFTGAMGRLVRREVDVVFTGFFIKDYFTRDLEFTASVYSDAVCCLVRKARRIPEYLLPLYIFPADIWAMLVGLGVLCSVCWAALRATLQWVRTRAAGERLMAATTTTAGGWLSRRYRWAVLFNHSRTIRRASRGRQLLQIVIDTYILLLSAPYQRFTRAGAERLFLAGLLLVSLIFVSLYQSGLAAVFVNPLYGRDISSLAQLDESEMAIPVKYRGFLDDVFAVNYSTRMDSLRRRMVHLPVQESMLTRVARLGNIATVTRKSSLALDNAVYMATRQLHLIPECPRTYNLAYVLQRRSVFGECFNRVLLRMVGGGLVQHWIDRMRYEWTLRNWRVVQSMMESNFKVLTVLDMQFAFCVLTIGLSLALFAIAGELLNHHYS